MVALSSFVSIVLAAAMVKAQVYPTEPAGETFNAGSNCPIAWNGDTNSSTIWQNMAIELMAGDNYRMVFITTVATGLDGTQNGTFNWTCPEVTVPAPIYFYQFISPESTTPQWTTRFTIADANGTTVAAPNATQPSQNGQPGKAIPWGVGTLSNPSAIIPPPSFDTFDTTASASGSTPSTTSSPAVVGQTTAANPSSTKMVTSTTPSPSGSTSNSNSTNSTASGKAGNSAISGHSLDVHVLQTAFVLFATSMGFLVLL